MHAKTIKQSIYNLKKCNKNALIRKKNFVADLHVLAMDKIYNTLFLRFKHFSFD